MRLLEKVEKLSSLVSNFACDSFTLTGDVLIDFRCPRLVLDVLAKCIKNESYSPICRKYKDYFEKKDVNELLKEISSHARIVSFRSEERCLDYLGFAEDYTQLNADLIAKSLARLSVYTAFHESAETISVDDVPEVYEQPLKYARALLEQLQLVLLYKSLGYPPCVKENDVFYAVVPPAIPSNVITSTLLKTLANINVESPSLLADLYANRIYVDHGNLAGVQVKEYDFYKPLRFKCLYDVIILPDRVDILLDSAGGVYSFSLEMKSANLSVILSEVESRVERFVSLLSKAFEVVEKSYDMLIRCEKGTVVAVSDDIFARVPLLHFMEALTGYKGDKAVEHFLNRDFLKYRGRIKSNLVGKEYVIGIPISVRDKVIDLFSLLAYYANVNLTPVSLTSKEDFAKFYNWLLSSVSTRIYESVSYVFDHIKEVLPEWVLSKDQLFAFANLPTLSVSVVVSVPILTLKSGKWYLYSAKFFGLAEFYKGDVQVDFKYKVVLGDKLDNISFNMFRSVEHNSIDLRKLEQVVFTIKGIFSTIDSLRRNMDDLSKYDVNYDDATKSIEFKLGNMRIIFSASPKIFSNISK